jgi:hypothetical protein
LKTLLKGSGYSGNIYQLLNIKANEKITRLKGKPAEIENLNHMFFTITFTATVVLITISKDQRIV